MRVGSLNSPPSLHLSHELIDDARRIASGHGPTQHLRSCRSGQARDICIRLSQCGLPGARSPPWPSCELLPPLLRRQIPVPQRLASASARASSSNRAAARTCLGDGLVVVATEFASASDRSAASRSSRSALFTSSHHLLHWRKQHVAHEDEKGEEEQRAPEKLRYIRDNRIARRFYDFTTF